MAKITTKKLDYTLKCKKKVWVYKKYNTTSTKITLIYKDEEKIKSSKESSNGFYYIDKFDGWAKKSCFKVTNKGDTDKLNEPAKPLTKKEKKALQDAAKKAAQKKAEQARLLKAQESAYATYVASDYGTSGNVTKSFLTNNINGIYGMPYQFASHIDGRITGTNYGAIYANRIVSKMPLLLMSPGKVQFMQSYLQSDKFKAIKQLLQVGTDNDGGSGLSTISSQGSGRYFTFDFAYADYFKYVNGMCRSGARFLNIASTKISSGGYTSAAGSFDWSKAINKSFSTYLGAPDTVAFYIDASSSIDESFSNTTGESQIASKVNSFADIGREIGFLLGTAVGDKPSWMDENDLETTIQEINSISSQYLNDNKILTDIAKNFATVATGGKLLFPEIWNDSEFSRSYDINVKLRSPDGDKLSWYLNIYVPLCHLICFAAPRQANGANGYMSPFLVRAFQKGLFNCDCGIITNMSISKGKEGSWTVDGLPTEVDVNFQLKDLYQMMSITKGDDAGWFINNTSLMDYIASTCGININKPEIERTLDIYLWLKSSKIKDFPNAAWMKATQGINNLLMDMYTSGTSLLR